MQNASFFGGNIWNKLRLVYWLITHGLRGEVKIKTMTDFPHIRFKKGALVHLHAEEGLLSLKN